MNKQYSNKLSNHFAEQICSDLKIIESIDYLKSEAIDSLQGAYGDLKRGFGDNESSFLLVYADNEFDWWFKDNLNDSQKKSFIAKMENEEHFGIDVWSVRRSNLELSFLMKLERTSLQEYTYLNIIIDFPNIEKDEYKIYAEMFGQLSDDEISQMLMMYQLKS
jgi:hypothetical protein